MAHPDPHVLLLLAVCKLAALDSFVGALAFLSDMLANDELVVGGNLVGQAAQFLVGRQDQVGAVDQEVVVLLRCNKNPSRSGQISVGKLQAGSAST